MIKDDIDNMNKLREMASELLDSIIYIDEYGYVGHFTITPESVKERTKIGTEHLRLALEAFGSIADDTKYQFEC